MNCCRLLIGSEKNAKAEKLLRDTGKAKEEEVSLLFLGTAECGKSTMAKQILILNSFNFSNRDREYTKHCIHINILEGIQYLIGQAQALAIPIQHNNFARRIMEEELNSELQYTADLATAIYSVWSEDSIQQLYKDISMDGNPIEWAPYFLDSCMKFADESYIPTDNDLLRTRKKTTGIKENILNIQNRKWRIIDVGGQRVERKRWVYRFEGVSCIVFFSALSDYDVTLIEDPTANRMRESLNVFEKTINNLWFDSKPVILFLNKKDLFEEKVDISSIRKCFPKYTGEDNYKQAVAYIKRQFLKRNANRDREIFIYETCALDPHNVFTVFSKVRQLILDQILQDTGIA